MIVVGKVSYLLYTHSIKTQQGYILQASNLPTQNLSLWLIDEV